VKEVRSDNFQGGFGVSDRAGGSNNSKVGFGGVGSTLDLVWCGNGRGRAMDEGKDRVKGKGKRPRKRE